jgi:hypothetical protein
MLIIPHGSPSIASVIGLDPGTDTLGCTALRFNIDTLEIDSWFAHTFKGKRMGRHSWVTEVHGEKYGRIDALGQILRRVYSEECPIAIGSESPFFSHLHPGSYRPLVEILTEIRMSVKDFDSWYSLYEVDPPTVKNTVGVKGNKGGKEGKAIMLQAVLNCPELMTTATQDVSQLDEHEIDSAVVALWLYKHLTR